jgi:hypothetical protein
MDKGSKNRSHPISCGLPDRLGLFRHGEWSAGLERIFHIMLHITCDLCGKELGTGVDRFVVKIEVFAAHDPNEITEADLEEDHMEAVSQMLQEMDDTADAVGIEPASNQFRYDMCPECRKRFVRNPLTKENAQKFDFSEN